MSRKGGRCALRQYQDHQGRRHRRSKETTDPGRNQHASRYPGEKSADHGGGHRGSRHGQLGHRRRDDYRTQEAGENRAVIPSRYSVPSSDIVVKTYPGQSPK